MNRFFLSAAAAAVLAFVTGCYPFIKEGVPQPGQALRPLRFFYPTFRDDMDVGSIVLAIERNLEYLNRLKPETLFRYGQDEFSVEQVRESQMAFLELLLKGLDQAELDRQIKKRFRIYRAAGRKVRFTGYYEPRCEGSLVRDQTFRYPLYRRPEDLVRIDLSLFSEKWKGESIVARIEGKKVLPYYSREEIDGKRMLEGRALELVWLKDPLEVALLHIQGSGRVRLRDGREMVVQYEASNGRPYRSMGRYMIEKGYLSPQELSMQAIRRYLREHPDVLEEVLHSNPSYVFFREGDRGPLGSLGVLLTPGRSLALDPNFFPKGALGFISCQKPVVNERGEIAGWTSFSRFVLNQDSGSAIKGPARADLFWGSGPYAELVAGHLQHEGELYLLIKKP